MWAHDEDASLGNAFKYVASTASYLEEIRIPHVAPYIECHFLSKNSFTFGVSYAERMKDAVAFESPFAVLMQRQSADMVVHPWPRVPLIISDTDFVRYAMTKRLTENELSNFSRLWHGGCVEAIIEAQDVDRNHSTQV